MKLVDYTKESTFLPRVQCADRDTVVDALVGALVAANGLGDAASLTREVLRREEEGSTAIGQGLAIPHARHAGADGIHLAVATLAEPLPGDPDADDDQPIDVVILLVGRAAADPGAMRAAFDREEARYLA